VFISLFAIFSSNLFVNKGSSQGLGNFLDKLFDGHDNGKNMKKKIEKELKNKRMTKTISKIPRRKVLQVKTTILRTKVI